MTGNRETGQGDLRTKKTVSRGEKKPPATTKPAAREKKKAKTTATTGTDIRRSTQKQKTAINYPAPRGGVLEEGELSVFM